jgi:hypothetical protein
MSTHENTRLNGADGQGRGAAQAAARSRTSESHLRDLVEILSEQPAGLRRWSVMRAMRVRRERGGRDVPQKFEDEIERAFRNRCAVETETPSGLPERDNGSALFYRPKERAGEVWAVFPERAKTWLSNAGD